MFEDKPDCLQADRRLPDTPNCHNPHAQKMDLADQDHLAGLLDESVGIGRHAHAQVLPGGITAAGDRDGAMGVLDDELEVQVARSS